MAASMFPLILRRGLARKGQVVPSLEISRATKLVALDMCAVGYKNAHVAIVFDISKGWIQRARRKLRIYGDVEGGRRKPGPKRQFRGEFRDLMPLEHC